MTGSIDIVVVSHCSTNKLWNMTAQMIRSAVRKPGMDIGEVLVIEGHPFAVAQPIGKMLNYDFTFNYNKCLNLGLFVSKSPYIAFCNNDLSFESNWAINAIKAMEQNNLMSVSPTPRHTFNGVREGYTIGKILLGWCIIVDRRIFREIGSFCEVVDFWFSDDVYALQLKAAGLKHALVGNSVVRHFGQASLMSLPGKKRAVMTRGQKKTFLDFKNKIYANSKS